MKKTIRFAVLGAQFEIPFSLLSMLALCYLGGVCISFLFAVKISDKLFSPFVLPGGTGVGIYLHCLLYAVFFVVLSLVFAGSYLGFVAFPLLAFGKGFFTALTVESYLAAGQVSDCLLLYGPLFTLEAAILLLYFAQSMRSSFGLFRGNPAEAAFAVCLRQFVIIGMCMVVFSLICGSVQYFL